MVTTWLKRFLSEVVDGLNDDPNAEVIIHYEKSRFNLFSGKVSVFGLHVRPNDKNPQAALVEIDVDRISISGLHFFELIRRQFDAHTINIERPVVRITRSGKTQNSEKRFKGNPLSVSWLKLKMRRGSVYINDPDSMQNAFEMHGLGLEMYNKQFSSIREMLNERHFELEDFTFRLDQHNKVHVTRSKINLDKGSAVFKKIFVGNQTPHNRFFRHLEKDTRWYNVHIDSAVTRNFLSQEGNDSVMRMLTVYQPDFFVKEMMGLPKDEETVPGGFKGLNIPAGEWNVVGGKLRWRTYKNKSSKYREFRIEHVDLRTVSSGHPAQTDSTGCISGTLNLAGIDLDLPGKQKFEVDEVSILMDKDRMKIAGIHYYHTEEPIRYLKNLQFGENWMDLKVDSVVEHSGEPPAFAAGQGFYSSQGMKIYGFHTEVKERGDLKKRPSRKARLMHDWFRAIPISHRMEDICFVNSSLGYQLFFDNTETEGSLFLNRINGCIDVLSNDAQYERTRISLYGRFNGKQYAYLKINLPVYDEEYRYYLKGHVQNLELRQLNTFVRPLKIKFNSGYMHRLTFSYHSKYANCTSRGETYFDYENLNMEALKTVKRAKKGLFGPGKSAREQDNWFLNMAINMFSKEYNMPDKDGYVVAEFEHSREPYQGFFGHMVHCMSKGAEYCLLKRKNKKKRKKLQ